MKEFKVGERVVVIFITLLPSLNYWRIDYDKI
jgi:hypothetical protein